MDGVAVRMISICLLTLVACMLSLLLTPLMRDWSLQLGWVDRPDNQRKIHAIATPRTGGVPILISYASVYLLLPALPVAGLDLHGHLPLVWRLFPPVALIFATGLLDDWLTLKPWQKLTGQLAASLCAYYSGVRILDLGGHPVAHWCSFLATIAWL